MYDYRAERPRLFTEEGIELVLKIRDQVKKLLAEAGAFREDKIRVTGDSWFALAAMDYLVERKELIAFPNGARQNTLYTNPAPYDGH